MLDTSKAWAQINVPHITVYYMGALCEDNQNTKNEDSKSSSQLLVRQSTEMSHYTEIFCAAWWQGLFFTIFGNLRNYIKHIQQRLFNKYFKISFKN